MPYIDPTKLSDYDAVVIGSGAAGGQSAYTLAMEGVRVLLLEAGRNYDPIRETPMFQTPEKAPLRSVATPDKPQGYYDATVNGGWELPGEPYTHGSQDPERKFTWWRSRMLGGRTNHWGRISLRNGPYDFKPYSRDGLGFDWPVSYEEIAPYYDKVEMLIGVYGRNDGLENCPHSSDGVLQTPPKARAAELLFHRVGGKMGIPVIPIHRAVLTERLKAQETARRLHPDNPRAARILAEEMSRRLACFWATPCVRGCSIKATYQSPTVHLPPALATGNLDILTNAMALEIETNGAGRANGVRFVDKVTGNMHVVRARLVFLAAGAMETVRLLLNSRSRRHPDGIGNSSGLLGRYIMDSVGSALNGQVPALENLPPHNEDGAGGGHVYAPWWQHPAQAAGRLDFPRGYYIGMGIARSMPSVRTFNFLESTTRGAYGARLKEEARRYYGSFVTFSARGEMVPNKDCYAELDPEVEDRWGSPVLRFHWKWGEHELRQAAHMQRTFAEVITAMGGKPARAPDPTGRRSISRGGSIVHEVGGAMMGERATVSVTNRFSQIWDAPNIIVADGASFCSNAYKNPTLTIMALAWRAADYAMAEMKRGNL